MSQRRQSCRTLGHHPGGLGLARGKQTARSIPKTAWIPTGWHQSACDVARAVVHTLRKESHFTAVQRHVRVRIRVRARVVVRVRARVRVRVRVVCVCGGRTLRDPMD